MRVYLGCAIFLLLMMGGLLAAERPCVQEKIATGAVNSVLPSLGFTLVFQKQVYFLDGLVSRSARRFLKIGDGVDLYASTNGDDRYGRKPVFVVSGDVFVQEKLLASGMAMIFASELNNDCLMRLRNTERRAELGKKGHWNGENASISAQNLSLLSTMSGKIALIHGKVVSVGDRKRRLYLNFGHNWSQDFTVSVVKSGSGAFKGNVARLGELRGRSVRIRGIVEQRQGPLIRLFDESQIEIMD